MASAAHAAAKRADAAALRAALAAGASTTWADDSNACTPLHWAAHEGSVDCVRVLLAAGADVAARALDGCTPLHSAAAQGHAACCRLLLDGGAAVDAADADGDTPLRLAATRGHADCAALLLSRGAANTADLPTALIPTANLAPASSSAHLQRGVRVSWLRAWTDEHSAWALPTWRVVQDIIVPATAASKDCYCALPSATPGPASVFVSHAWGAPWGSLVSALAGAVPPEAYVWVDVFAITQHDGVRQRADLLALKEVVEGSTVLLLVVCLSDEAARLLGGDGAPTVEQLVERGCATMLPPLRIWCVFEIFTAIETPRPIIMQLGSLDADCRKFSPNRNSNVVVNLMNTVDVRLAQATVAADRASILQQVEAHAGADAVNAKVAGALLGAFSCADWPEVTHAACGNAAPLAAVAASGAAALNERRGEKEQTAAHAAAGAGFTTVLQGLLADGADPAAPNVMQRTPLHRAAEGGHLGCIAALLADPRVRIDARDERGSTALYMAAAGGQLAALRALEAAGGDAHARTAKGASALHTACVNAQLPMVRYLLSCGFDASAADDEHNTPVMRACFAGCVPVLEELVAAGASLGGADADGMTAVMCAADSGHTHALRWLHAAGASFEGRTTAAWERGAGRSPAAVAAEAGHAEALRFLLSVMSNDAEARAAELRSLQLLELPQGEQGDAVRLVLREQP
jgi:ankyrin repeat protein